MAEAPRRSTQEALRKHFPTVMEAYSALRRTLDAAGPLDRKTRELILLGGFTVGRQEGGYRAHCRFALDAGASPEEIRQATIVTFGANAPVESIADALTWAEDVIASWEPAPSKA